MLLLRRRRKRKLNNIPRTRDREIPKQARRFKLIEDESAEIGNVSERFKFYVDVH